MEGPPSSCLLERSAQHKLELCTHCQKIAKLSNCEGWSGRSNCSRTVRYSPVIPPTDPSRDAGHVMGSWRLICSCAATNPWTMHARRVDPYVHRARVSCLSPRADGRTGAMELRTFVFVRTFCHEKKETKAAVGWVFVSRDRGGASAHVDLSACSSAPCPCVGGRLEACVRACRGALFIHGGPTRLARCGDPRTPTALLGVSADDGKKDRAGGGTHTTRACNAMRDAAPVAGDIPFSRSAPVRRQPLAGSTRPRH